MMTSNPNYAANVNIIHTNSVADTQIDSVVNVFTMNNSDLGSIRLLRPILTNFTLIDFF